MLMSVYKKEKAQYLDESIKSILEQTIKPDEFVIVCDGELTRELDTVLGKYYAACPEVIRIVRLPQNVGLGNALNQGIKYCTNDIIARMDSDDISFRDRCEKQLRIIEQGVDVVSGTVLEFEDDIEAPGVSRKLPSENDDIYHFARRRNPFNHPCVMYRKEVVEKAGGYKDFYLFEDYYLWARILLLGASCYNIPSPLLYMRAGNSMYTRRGGWKYLKSMIRFRWYLYRCGIASLWDFIVSALGQSIICLIPNAARRFFYKVALRN